MTNRGVSERILRANLYVEHLVNREAAERDRLKRFEDGKKVANDIRPLGDRSVEWHFGVCLQQNAYGGWGYLV